MLFRSERNLQSMKICGKCNESKPASEFHRRGDDHQRYCKPCKRAADAERYKNAPQHRHRQRKAQRKARAADARALKEGKPCTDCGHTFHFSAMEWDHLPGSKKTANPSNLANNGLWERFLKEIENCELVCANCHAVRTFNRR